MTLAQPAVTDPPLDPTAPWQKQDNWPYTHRPRTAAAAPSGAAALLPDTFSAGTFNFQRMAHAYKVYVPPALTFAAPPCLIVMLHGCGQDPDDFALGTRMNALARQCNSVVVYPAQSKEANSHQCWNWYEPAHQSRGHGEPAWIAALARSLAGKLDVDMRRVFVAGLSAGGTMAATVAQCYPELFAACAVHSALPARAAQGVINALSAMRSGQWTPQQPMRAVPTIVFHGADDDTVHPLHGRHVVQAAAGAKAGRDGRVAAQRGFDEGLGVTGADHVRTVFHDARGVVHAEHWDLAGHGHAWSGGDAQGSYAAATGPDASHEMLRFFFAVAPPPRSWLARTEARIRRSLAQSGDAVPLAALQAL